MMLEIPSQEHSTEFKGQAVRRGKCGKSGSAIAKEMGLLEHALPHRVKAFDLGTLDGTDAPQVSL
jgi:transposase-like protein